MVASFSLVNKGFVTKKGRGVFMLLCYKQLVASEWDVYEIRPVNSGETDKETWEH